MNNYYNYYESPIGTLEIVTCNEGLREINFNPQSKQSITQNSTNNNVIEQLDEYFSGKRKIFNIPLIIDGTEFQKRVWDQLLNVPYGAIATYKDIAISLNSPNSCRAVGGANNKNKIPIIIPCHRIIGTNGKLVGYAGGLDIKKWLLEHELSNL